MHRRATTLAYADHFLSIQQRTLHKPYVRGKKKPAQQRILNYLQPLSTHLFLPLHDLDARYLRSLVTLTSTRPGNPRGQEESRPSSLTGVSDDRRDNRPNYGLSHEVTLTQKSLVLPAHKKRNCNVGVLVAHLIGSLRQNQLRRFLTGFNLPKSGHPFRISLSASHLRSTLHSICLVVANTSTITGQSRQLSSRPTTGVDI